jgi:hypothetical protein
MHAELCAFSEGKIVETKHGTTTYITSWCWWWGVVFILQIFHSYFSLNFSLRKTKKLNRLHLSLTTPTLSAPPNHHHAETKEQTWRATNPISAMQQGQPKHKPIVQTTNTKQPTCQPKCL